LNQEISKLAHTDSDASAIREFMKERQELKRFMQSGPFPTVSLQDASDTESQ
jgi:hypothetical protein